MPLQNSVGLSRYVLIVMIVITGVLLLNKLPAVSTKSVKNDQNKSQDLRSSPSLEFSFYEVLKADEVLVTDSNYTSTPKDSNLSNPILLQIAATSSESSARNLADKLIQGGLKNVIIVTRPSSNGMLYLVRTTPYLIYDKLKAGLDIAEKLNHHPDKIEIKN